MLNRLKSLLKKADTPNRSGQHSFAEKQIAAAALLVEAAQADQGMGDKEKAAIQSALIDHFDLDEETAEELLSLGESNQADAVELHRFTRTLKEAFDDDERIQLIELLWRVVLADGVLHHYEDQLLRRIAGLLYVSDRARGEARQRAQQHLEDSKNHN